MSKKARRIPTRTSSSRAAPQLQCGFLQSDPAHMDVSFGSCGGCPPGCPSTRRLLSELHFEGPDDPVKMGADDIALHVAWLCRHELTEGSQSHNPALSAGCTTLSKSFARICAAAESTPTASRIFPQYATRDRRISPKLLPIWTSRILASRPNSGLVAVGQRLAPLGSFLFFV